MGSVGGLLGMSGGSGGTGFGINGGTTGDQLAQTNGEVQNGLSQQWSLLNALANQNGVNNQSQVYNQLQGIASGNGPNPAQAMLNQSTGANVANQASLMAGQRGAGSNVGLMARQAAQQGASAQQQAAGQGATMQANQSLNALGQAGSMANNMASQQIGQTNQYEASSQGAQGILQGANTAYNNIQGQLANTTLQGQQAMTGGIMQGLGSGISSMMAHGGRVQKFDEGGPVDNGSVEASVNNNPSQEGDTADWKGWLLGDNGEQSSAPTGSGDVIPQITSGAGAQSMFGQSANNNNAQAAAGTPISYGPDSGAAALAKGASSMASAGMSGSGGGSGGGGGGGGIMSLMALMSKGGNVGEQLKNGGHVPGAAKVKGDSYKNDTVDAKLSPGEVVIPRSVMQSKDPVRGAASFVQSVMAKKRVKS